MRYFGHVIRVPEGKYEEYVEKHNNISPTLLEKMKAVHIETVTIFYRDGFLFKYVEYSGDDYEADMKRLADDEEQKKWIEYTSCCQQPVESAKPNEWWAPMEEAFHM